MNSYESRMSNNFANPSKKIDKTKINRIKSAKRKKLRIFDELEAKDDFIQNCNTKIKKIKKGAIEQLIYTNKRVPQNWQKKETYQKEIYDLFHKNPKFLLYLGKGYNPQTELKLSSGQKENENNNISTNEKNKDNQNDSFNLLSKKMKNKIKKLSLSPICENQNYKRGKKISNTMPNIKNNYNKKDDSMKTKEIINILDELGTEYPIKDKINDLFAKEEVEKINNTCKNFHPVIDDRKRKQVFKNNICLNLISSYKDKKVKKEKKSYDNKFKKEINFAKLKREMIKNPFVLKNLERINFYGPHYSYCSLCGIKNIDFYQRLSIKQLNKITNEIRKYRNLI